MTLFYKICNNITFMRGSKKGLQFRKDYAIINPAWLAR